MITEARRQGLEALFTSDELKRLEAANPDGLGLAQVLELFRQRGVTIAEATFRKYVQLGLLPRSRRVGRKGKHRGSHGLYPATVIERIAQVRAALDAGVRIDALRHSSVSLQNDIDAIERATTLLITRLEGEATTRNVAAASTRKLATLKQQAKTLSDGLEEASRDICPADPGVAAPKKTRRTPVRA